MKYNSSRSTRTLPLPLKKSTKKTPNKQNKKIKLTTHQLLYDSSWNTHGDSHSNQPLEMLHTPEQDILPQTHLLATEHPPFPLWLCPQWQQPLCNIWVLLMLLCRELAGALAIRIWSLQKRIQVVRRNGTSISRPFTCGNPSSVIPLLCSQPHAAARGVNCELLTFLSMWKTNN